MEEVKFTVAVDPRPAPRPRFGSGRCWLPKPYREYQSEVRAAAKGALNGRLPLTGELEIRAKFFRKFASTSRRFGDGDNLLKSVTDALNGLLFDDDSQVVRFEIEKLTDKQNPRAEVSIKEILRDTGN